MASRTVEHADQVRPERLEHPDLGGGLVAPAQQPRVDALGDAGHGRRGGRPQPRAVELGEVGEAGPDVVRGVRPGHRARPGQVEVIADDDRRPGAVRRDQRPRGVGEHDRSAPRHDRGPHAVDDGGDRVILVQVRAPRQHQRRHPADVQRVRRPRMALDRGRREPRQLRHRPPPPAPRPAPGPPRPTPSRAPRRPGAPRGARGSRTPRPGRRSTALRAPRDYRSRDRGGACAPRPPAPCRRRGGATGARAARLRSARGARRSAPAAPSTDRCSLPVAARPTGRRTCW